VEEPVPMVQKPSTSHDATAPRVLRQSRPVHQRHTRNNTPINLQEENTDDDCTAQTSNVSTTSKQTRKHQQRVNKRAEAAKQREEEEEAVEAAIKDISELPKPPFSPATCPRRTVAQYCAKRQTADILNSAAPVPISQDDDEDDCANATIAAIPQLFSTTTPCGISQHAIYHLMGQALEQDMAAAFIPNRFALQQSYKVPIDHYALGCKLRRNSDRSSSRN
jgi:hypothetical protein